MPHITISWHDVLRFWHAWIYVLKYPLAFIAGWAGIYLQRWRKQRAENAALGWPSVNGRINSGTFKEIPKIKHWLVTLEYTYFVGEYRTGKYVHEFQSAEEAGDFVRVMLNKEVPIRYKESNPNKSVLEQRAIEQHILLAPRFG